MSLFLVLLAAGDSKRFNSSTPKPFYKINNKTLLEHSFNAFSSFIKIKKTIVVYNKKHKKHIDRIKLKNSIKITGGNNRQESTFKALKLINKMKCKKILIHDAARPNPSKKLINKIINKLNYNHAVVPIIKVSDATKRFSKNLIFKNIRRDNLGFTQTPQGFTFNKIFKMHKINTHESFDDDSALFTLSGEKVLTINGNKRNLKITDMEDLDLYNSLKKRKIYTGIGFDVHKFVSKRKLYLGGLKIPFNLGLEGHSDADPVLHALMDALLGACRLGDIGKLFSNKNKKYKNVRSTILLKEVVALTQSKNFFINNIDINIITQKPSIKRYSKKMINLISKLCKINTNQISIKGKTTEKLGLIGKGKAIAAECIVTVWCYD